MKSFIQHIQEKTMATAALAGIIGGTALGLSDRPQPTEPQQAVTTTIKQEQPEQPKQSTKAPAWHSLISGSEGMRNSAYWDQTGKVWTIGKGSTTHPDGRPVRQGDTISTEQADQYMQHYVNKNLVPKLEKIPTWSKMNDNQRGALISFGYNVGPNFYGSKGFETISKALSSEQTLGSVPGALKLYNKSGGKVLRGLVTRREAEGSLWNSPIN
jgi:GH24 family phage-related lysozyme (muramidase)